MVGAPFLLDILAPAAFAELVDLIDAVPVHMDSRRILVLPGDVGVLGLVQVGTVVVRIRIVEIARRVAVVVRTGVLGIVPVHSGVAVLSETEEEGRAALELVRRGVVVLGYGHGLVGLADAGIAHPAVLVAPVGIVHIVAHKVVDLLGGSHLGSPLSGSAEEDQAQFVGIVKDLVGGQIIGETAIVNAFDPVVSAKTGADVGRGERSLQLRQLRILQLLTALPRNRCLEWKLWLFARLLLKMLVKSQRHC